VSDLTPTIDPTMQKAVQTIGAIPIATWLAKLQKETRPNHVSTAQTGAYFLPDLQKESFRGGKYGGFFAPVSHDSLPQTVATLFADQPDKGQWLLDYLKYGEPSLIDRFKNTRPTLTDQQQLFVKRFDEMMLSLLNGQMSTARTMAANAFIPIFRDETITDKELYGLLQRVGIDKDLQRMGDPLAMQWVLFTGGVLQGLADYESAASIQADIGTLTARSKENTSAPNLEQIKEGLKFLNPGDLNKDRRYLVTEFEPFYSPVARETLYNINRNTIFALSRDIVNFDTGLPSYVSGMESVCGTDLAWTFKPGSTPPYLPAKEAGTKAPDRT